MVDDRGRPRLSAEPRPARVPRVLRRARPAAGRGGVRGDGRWSCPTRRHGGPQLTRRYVLHRAARVRQLGAAAGHREPEGGARRRRRRRRVSACRRTGERLLAARTSTTRATRSSSSRSPTCCTRSTRRSSTPASCVQVDDAVLVHEYDSILSLGGSVEDYRKWAELRVEATNHALRDIPEERVRYHVCHGSWHGPHVFDPPLADVIDLVLRVHGPLLLDRAGERAPRARVAALGGREAARGEGADPRRRHAPHERRRAPRARRRAARPAREASSAPKPSWAGPTAASRRAPSSAACTRRSSGRSSQALAEGARLATKELFGAGAVA